MGGVNYITSSAHTNSNYLFSVSNFSQAVRVDEQNVYFLHYSKPREYVDKEQLKQLVTKIFIVSVSCLTH